MRLPTLQVTIPLMEEMKDDDLAEYVDYLNRSSKAILVEAERIEKEMLKRLVDREATRMYTERFDVRRQGGWVWHEDKLEPLLKMLEGEQLDSVYTPATEKTTPVAEKWNKRALESLRKQGGDVGAVIQDARTKKKPSLKITEKKT